MAYDFHTVPLIFENGRYRFRDDYLPSYESFEMVDAEGNICSIYINSLPVCFAPCIESNNILVITIMPPSPLAYCITNETLYSMPIIVQQHNYVHLQPCINGHFPTPEEQLNNQNYKGISWSRSFSCEGA